MKINGTDIIILNTEGNPKREGSAARIRFANYEDGMTIDEALAAGLRRDDFHWDREHGFITIISEARLQNIVNKRMQLSGWEFITDHLPEDALIV